MNGKTGWYRIVWSLTIALILILCLWLVSPLSIAAQSITDFFKISYDPVSFSKKEIHGSETISITVTGQATCTKALPLSASKGSITGSVVAEHVASGTRVTLNSSYTISINPFPSKEGDTTEIEQVVPLQFPSHAESGEYNVIGKLIEAKVEVTFVWIDVTGFLPQEQLMGSLKYIALEPTPTPESTPTITTAASAVEPTSPNYALPWWVWLIVTIAVTTTTVNVIWFLRHRPHGTTS